MGLGFRESSYALGMDKSDENSPEALTTYHATLNNQNLCVGS